MSYVEPLLAPKHDAEETKDFTNKISLNNIPIDKENSLAQSIHFKIPAPLIHLNTVSLEHQHCFLQAAIKSNVQSWLYYFPFLYCFSKNPTQTILWEQIDESICLYFLRQRDDDPRLDLYFPPFPYSSKALKAAVNRVHDFNGEKTCQIMWIEEAQRLEIEKAGFKTIFREEEFIYDTHLVIEASGKQFDRLRKETNKAYKIPNLEIREFRIEDQENCYSLLNRWRHHLINDRNINIGGYTYTRNALTNAFSFKDDILRGEVIIIDGAICAFTFGGKISSNHGSIFTTISDHTFNGLGYLQRKNFIKNHPEFAFYNDSSDTGRQGISQVKDAFRPVTKNKLYRAR